MDYTVAGTQPLVPPPILNPNEIEWKYEMRRDCQQIIPGLLLGPFQVSKSLEKLEALKITHIVCIRDAKEAFSVKPRFPDRFQYLVLDVQDTEDQNLIRMFPTAKQFIDQAIAQGGHVLVHCNGGISLAPAFVVMFVMEHYQMPWEDALHMVQNRRYCISPNGGFLTQIKEYESIYKANIAVSKHGSAAPSGSTRRKRVDDDDDDNEMADARRREAPLPRKIAPLTPSLQKTASAEDVEMS